MSSETSYDFLRFYLDGTEQTGSLARISGVVNWVEKSVSIPTGSHTVKWSYTKDGSISSNLDTAWVDQVVYTPTPKPEIAVEQPLANDLTDGVASIDFGGVNAGGNSEALVFTVRNPGTAALNGLVITKDGADAADFTVGSLGATTLAPGASTTFTVTLAPASPGTRSAAIHLASNDADENSFDISLTGYGRTAVESWRFAHYGIITNTGNAANMADVDGDTFLNLMEYAFKMDPTLADDYPVTRAMTAGSVSITYPRNTAATDVTFTIQESEDLAATIPWAAATVTEEILDTTNGVETVKATRTLLPGDEQLFLRLKISLSP